MTKIILEDMKVLRYCNRGAREFAARHGLNWQTFITEGIDVSVVDKIDDEMMRACIEQARKRESGAT